MDELMEVLVADYSADFLGDTLHILKNLLKLSNELTLGWFKCHIISSKAHSCLDTILFLIILFIHLCKNSVGTLLVDPDLSFNNHVIDQSDESSKTVVVSLGKLQNSVLKLVFLLLKNHRLVFSSLTHLGVFEILLLLESARIAHSQHEQRKSLADNLIDSFVVVTLNQLSRSFLVIDKVSQVDSLATFWNTEGLLDLHVPKGPADVHEACEEGWSSLDQVTSKALSCSIVHLETDVTLPKSENLSNYVVFEEFHACENIEHRGLLHPLTQREELGWDSIGVLAFLSFVLRDMNDSLC
jgi:hypothetical protein